jgi:hypothetical protein
LGGGFRCLYETGVGEGARRACMSLEKAKTLMVVEVRRKLL